MPALDPAIKNVLLIALMLGMGFVFFIILLVMTYRKRQTRLLIETRLKEAELKQVKLQGEIDTLKAINAEKERISADIHDDMGGNVSSINLLSKLLQAEQAREQNLEHLREMQIQSLELSQKMKDIVWATKSENDTLDHLLQYIRQYAVKQLEPLGFQVHFLTPESLPPLELNGEMRKDLFMGVKEILNNIIKHSGAKRVEIRCSLQQQAFTLAIQDDGKGLPAEPSDGNGLKQIQKRLQKYGGSVTFENKPGLRVELNLTLPLPSTKG